MAIDFPNSPTNGQQFYAPNGVIYQFQSAPAPGVWVAVNPGPSTRALQLYDEKIALSGDADMRVNIPANAKKIEIDFVALTVDGTDSNLWLNPLTGGTSTIYNAATHDTQWVLAAASTTSAPVPAGQVSIGQTGWTLGTAGSFAGNLQLKPWSPTPQTLGTGTAWAIQAAGNRIVLTYSFDGGTVVPTGYRLAFGTKNLGAGAYMRTFASW
jgi:hypothetical protein